LSERAAYREAGDVTNLKDIAAGILELQVYHGILPGGAPMELAITLLDVTNDALPLSKTMRDHGAQAYGMLFFKSASPRCPKEGLIWEKCEDRLEVTAADDDRHLLDKAFHALCLQTVAAFLAETANKDPKYAWLTPPSLH